MNAALADMLRYNRWAMLELIGSCRTLTNEQLATRPPGLSGTIGGLLMHVVGGQQAFVARTQGAQADDALGRWSSWPGFEELLSVATVTSDRLADIAEGLDDDPWVALPYMGIRQGFPLRFFLVHAVEHGVEHRTEIKVGLQQLGIETPDLDGWSYASAVGYGAAAVGDGA